MAQNNIGLPDHLLIDCLDIAAKQRKRTAEKFRPGSAARAEIDAEVGQITMALNTLKANPTPIETEINKKK